MPYQLREHRNGGKAHRPTEHSTVYINYSTINVNGLAFDFEQYLLSVTTKCLILYRLPPAYLVNNGSAIHYSAVRCDGTEATLSQCSYSTNTTECDHTWDAVVVCRQS